MSASGSPTPLSNAAMPLQPAAPQGARRDLLAGGAALGIAALLEVYLLATPAANSLLYVPVQHFYIVTGVSILTLVLAVVLAIGTAQIGLYRLLLLTLAFGAMGGLFAVHGLATPGILIHPETGPDYRGTVLGLSAFLSLAIPSVLLTAAYLPVSLTLDRTMPFWPAGWFVVALVVLVGAYGVLAIGSSSEAVAALPLSFPPGSYVLAGVSVVLFCFSALRQFRIHRVARLPLQGALCLAFLFLALAQVAMVLAPVWTLAWWEYHLLMLAGVALALRALATEQVRGKPLRAVLEAAFDLEVVVGVEMENVDTIAALAAAVEVKDRETAGHNVRVAELSVAIGREMGLKTPQLRVLARSGLLHDVGKLGVPDAILHKPGPLDDEEWKVIRTHPEIGVRILERAGSLRPEIGAVLYHHERVDGSGYPRGLAGDAIPLEARIVAVADTYDVLISDRPYRRGRSPDQAVLILEQERGTHLDSAAVDALLRILRTRA